MCIRPLSARARLIRDGSTDLTLDEVAAHAGLSPARLSRLFKQQTGFAMVDFRNRRQCRAVSGVVWHGPSASRCWRLRWSRGLAAIRSFIGYSKRWPGARLRGSGMAGETLPKVGQFRRRSTLASSQLSGKVESA